MNCGQKGLTAAASPPTRTKSHISDAVWWQPSCQEGEEGQSPCCSTKGMFFSQGSGAKWYKNESPPTSKQLRKGSVFSEDLIHIPAGRGGILWSQVPRKLNAGFNVSHVASNTAELKQQHVATNVKALLCSAFPFHFFCISCKYDISQIFLFVGCFFLVLVLAGRVDISVPNSPLSRRFTGVGSNTWKGDDMQLTN